MKRQIKTLMILSLLASITACNNVKTEPQELSIHNEIQVELDGDKHWIANSETTDGINNMIQLMNSFGETDNVGPYKSLSNQLELQFQIIFQKCTMTGAAHDQLHNYLFPMKEQFKKLSSDNLSECKSAFDHLKMHLATYRQYFE